MQRFSNFPIWPYIILATLWLFWQIFTDELAGIIRSLIPEGGVIMYGITHPYVIMPALLVLVSLYLLWKRHKNKKDKTQAKSKEIYLPEILVAMHERLGVLKTTQEKKKIDKKKFEDSTPILLDKLELVKLAEYESYQKSWKRELKKLVPKSRKRLLERFWRLKVISKGQEIKNELVSSKEWQMEDAAHIGEWLDSIGMGIGILRDNDDNYKQLVRDLRPYMTDSVLRGLIDKHMSLSYAYCSALLDLYYSRRLVKNSFEQIAHSALTASEISPQKIEAALGEVIGKINKRLDSIKTKGLALVPKEISQEILDTLANFIPEGENIREQCYNQKEKVPEREAKEWAEKVAIFLDKLGSHYRPTFYNSDGLGRAKIPLMYSSEHQRVALFASYRLMRIQQFLAELRQK